MPVCFQVREGRAKEEQMTETIQGLQSDNEILHGQVTQLQRRVEECNEVIDAVKTQLVDYKTMLTLVRGARSLQPTHSLVSRSTPFAPLPAHSFRTRCGEGRARVEGRRHCPARCGQRAWQVDS